jgi:Uma2 family endonuclease
VRSLSRPPAVGDAHGSGAGERLAETFILFVGSQIMGSATLISPAAYLNTSYEPDMELVNGVLVERNVGTQLHGLLQTLIAVFFSQYRKSHRIDVFTETRLLVDAGADRYRIPDVMVLGRPYTKGKIVVDVPAIVVEIKSPDDTFDDIVNRCFDYEQLNVGNILVMDPDNKRAWLFRQGNLQILTGTSVKLPVQALTIDFPFVSVFADLDDE